VLLGAVQGIADLIVRPGLINVDFADVRTVMSEMGLAMMGTGSARGDDRAQAAPRARSSNPLLEDINLKGACGILVNITAGPDLTMARVPRSRPDRRSSSPRTTPPWSSAPCSIRTWKTRVRVTVVATGLNRNTAGGRQPAPRSEARYDSGFDAPRRPQVQLINTQGKRDGTTGLMIDEVSDPFVPGANTGFVGGLRRNVDAGPAVAELPKDDYLDIPAFLRRQAD
jgi:cell division protein FtsZ